jgi:hypothetical protein
MALKRRPHIHCNLLPVYPALTINVQASVTKCAALEVHMRDVRDAWRLPAVSVAALVFLSAAQWSAGLQWRPETPRLAKTHLADAQVTAPR